MEWKRDRSVCGTVASRRVVLNNVSNISKVLPTLMGASDTVQVNVRSETDAELCTFDDEEKDGGFADHAPLVLSFPQKKAQMAVPIECSAAGLSSFVFNHADLVALTKKLAAYDTFAFDVRRGPRGHVHFQTQFGVVGNPARTFEPVCATATATATRSDCVVVPTMRPTRPLHDRTVAQWTSESTFIELKTFQKFLGAMGGRVMLSIKPGQSVTLTTALPSANIDRFERQPVLQVQIKALDPGVLKDAIVMNLPPGVSDKK